MYRPKGFYFWLIGLSLLLPLMELIVFSIIYNSFIELAARISACYIPISIISGIFLLYLMMSTSNKSGKKYVFCGYIISMCVTIAVSVFLKNIPQWIVANFIGGVILIGGTLLAYITNPRNNPFYI